MINTIKDLAEIHGKPVLHLNGAIESDAPISHFVVDHKMDRLSFNMLTKPASEGGDLNRCQFTELIGVAKVMLESLNEKFPCRENAMTITKLDEALLWQAKRTVDRMNRGVEGKNES